MRYAVMAVVLAVAGFFAWQQFKPKPVVVPTPIPTPAILLEPAPVISEAEQAKVIKSAHDQDPAVRWEAIVFLDKMKVPMALDLLFEKLHKDQDLALRAKVIALLAQRGAQQPADARIAEHLILAAKDPEPDIRLAALQALQTIGDYSVASAITNSLKDQDERVRLQALRTLNALQDRKAAVIEEERKHQEELRLQAEQAAKNR